MSSQKSHPNDAQTLRRSICERRGPRPALLTTFLRTRGWSRRVKRVQRDVCAYGERNLFGFRMFMSRKKSLACSRKMGRHCGRGRRCEVDSPLTTFVRPTTCQTYAIAPRKAKGGGRESSVGFRRSAVRQKDRKETSVRIFSIRFATRSKYRSGR